MKPQTGQIPSRGSARPAPQVPRHLALTATAVVAADQLSKLAASTRDTTGHAGGVIGNAAGLAGLVPVEGTPMLLLGLVALGVFLLIGLALVERGRAHPVTLGLLAGGAAGNLLDRAALGYVRDFIWTPWLVINVADLFLLAGGAAFTIHALRTISDPI